MFCFLVLRFGLVVCGVVVRLRLLDYGGGGGGCGFGVFVFGWGGWFGWG